MIPKTIGILGGMGPEATALLFRYIIDNTLAEKDQEHIPVIIDNNTAIPDRSGYLLYEGADPLPEMIRSANRLEQAGAEFLIMPCNTGHYFIDEINRECTLPFVHMIEAVGDYVSLPGSRDKKTGLMATMGTYHTGIYHTHFKQAGLSLEQPDSRHRQITMDAIYGKKGIKAGHKEEPFRLLQPVFEAFKEKRVEAVISGCTELSVLFEEYPIPSTHINPLLLLARAAITKAGYPLK